jgi:hypothetical protein
MPGAFGILDEARHKQGGLYAIRESLRQRLRGLIIR